MAQGALRAVESLAADAQNWLNALNPSELLPLGEKLERIKQLAKEWQEVLKEISENLEEQRAVFSNFLKQIDKIREKKLNEEEYRKTFALKEIVAYLGIGGLWVDEIREG